MYKKKTEFLNLWWARKIWIKVINQCLTWKIIYKYIFDITFSRFMWPNKTIWLRFVDGTKRPRGGRSLPMDSSNFSMTFSNRHQSQPDGSNKKNSIDMLQNGGWNDRKWWYNNSFVCEMVWRPGITLILFHSRNKMIYST